MNDSHFGSELSDDLLPHPPWGESPMLGGVEETGDSTENEREPIISTPSMINLEMNSAYQLPFGAAPRDGGVQFTVYSRSTTGMLRGRYTRSSSTK